MTLPSDPALPGPQDARPEIAVCLPVFNGEATIEKAVASVLAQTYPHFELLIYDDKSTDDTVAVVRRLAETDPRIRLIEGGRNLGRGGARNALLRAAGDRLVAWQDDDDHWQPGKLKRQVEFIEAMGLAGDFLVLSTYARLAPRRREAPGAPRRREVLVPPLLYSAEFMLGEDYARCPFQLQSCIGPARTFLKEGGFNAVLNWSEDFDLALRLLLSGTRIIGDPNPRPVMTYHKNVPDEDVWRILKGHRLIYDAQADRFMPRLMLEESFFRKRHRYAFNTALQQNDPVAAAGVLVEELSHGSLPLDALPQVAERLLDLLGPALLPFHVRFLKGRCDFTAALRRIHPGLDAAGARMIQENFKNLVRRLHASPRLARQRLQEQDILGLRDELAALLQDTIPGRRDADEVQDFAWKLLLLAKLTAADARHSSKRAAPARAATGK